jgi:hypothetical protein
MAKNEVSVKLLPDVDFTALVIKRLVMGFPMEVKIDQELILGHITTMEFAKGSDHAFATVCYSKQEGEEEPIDFFINIAIYSDGKIIVTENQQT